MSFDDIQKKLSSKSKLLLEFIDNEQDNNSYARIKERSEFKDDELKKCLKELNDE